MALLPNAARIFAQLPSTWSLARDIPGTGVFSGTATFIPGGDHLMYEEKGETLDFIKDTSAATHLCGMDRYAHNMTWVGDGRFETHVRVQGPAKDFDIRSVFSRLT